MKNFHSFENMKESGLNDILGGETTSTTLTWLLLCLAINAEAQEKLHAEIDQVVGSGRFPVLADRSRYSNHYQISWI